MSTTVVVKPDPTRETTDEAAKKYAEKKWVIGQQAVCMDGFKAGAKWMKEKWEATLAQQGWVKIDPKGDE